MNWLSQGVAFDFFFMPYPDQKQDIVYLYDLNICLYTSADSQPKKAINGRSLTLYGLLILL